MKKTLTTLTVAILAVLILSLPAEAGRKQKNTTLEKDDPATVTVESPNLILVDGQDVMDLIGHPNPENEYAKRVGRIRNSKKHHAIRLGVPRDMGFDVCVGDTRNPMMKAAYEAMLAKLGPEYNLPPYKPVYPETVEEARAFCEWVPVERIDQWTISRESTSRWIQGPFREWTYPFVVEFTEGRRKTVCRWGQNVDPAMRDTQLFGTEIWDWGTIIDDNITNYVRCEVIDMFATRR